MADIKMEIERYEKKMKSAETMTDLLTSMAAWQSFADSRGLNSEQRGPVDRAYIEAEARLIAYVRKTPW